MNLKNIKNLDHLNLKDVINSVENYMMKVNSYQLKTRDSLLKKDSASWTAKEKKQFKAITKQIEQGVEVLNRLEQAVSFLFDQYIELSDSAIQMSERYQRLEKKYIHAKLESSKNRSESQEYEGLWLHAMNLAKEAYGSELLKEFEAIKQN